VSTKDWWIDNFKGKTKVLGEKPASVSLYPSQNPTWTILGLNLDLHDEKPTSNHLNYGTDIGLRPSGI
jgi:hypothetical protein